MRVLLVSPVASGGESNGDMQYTEDLLTHPPSGVEYVSVADALDAGEIVGQASWRGGGPRPDSLAAAASATARLGVNGLRRFRVLLPDGVHWWRVVGDFDAVHVHCLPVHLSGAVPPMLVTDSAGTFWYWTAARGMDDAGAWRLLRRERRVARLAGYTHPSANTELAAAVLLFVEEGLDLLDEVGLDRSRAGVAPPGVPPARTANRQHDQPTMLFVARNFEIKGGAVVLHILEEVRRRVPTARLIVAGSDNPDPGLPGVTWLGPCSREELYERAYPEADVFVYPTTFDCAPLVVMEAMAHGVPVVAPRSFGLPSLVGDGEGGTLYEPGDVTAATQAAWRLLTDDDLSAKLRAGARHRYGTRLSTSVRNGILADTYRWISSAGEARRQPGEPGSPFPASARNFR
jgi:glycosyltransferase involved in cell wall biosynthesis